MKLIRFGLPGQEKPGVVTTAGMLDVSAFGEDFGERFFESDGVARLAQWLTTHAATCPPVAEGTRLGAPLQRPSKIVCIGLNYSDHAAETGAAIPKEPIVFFKSTSAVVGPNDDLVIPKNSQKTDWEVELAVVIGKKASHVAEREALQYVAGYCLHNDYSERAWQMERGGQWVKGKSADTYAPLGPWLVTPDEIADVHKLPLWLTVNGQRMQNGNTKHLIFNIPFLIAYLSEFMTLLPGDVISTGTPAGVGLGMNPQVYLKPGDVIALGIEGLGSATQRAVAY